MTQEYALFECDYPEAEAFQTLSDNGCGFIVPPRERGRSYTVVNQSSKLTAYYWPLKSATLQRLLSAAIKYEFPEDAPSWTRLSKYLTREFISPDRSGIAPYPLYKKYSEHKQYWHKLKCVAGSYENITELDLKSAYATAISKLPSLWLASPGNWKDDGGAIENFRALFPNLEKQLRLSLIGCWASAKLPIIRIDKENPGEFKRSIIDKTFDGGLFNSVHYALFSLSRFLTKLDEEYGSYIPRIHTDSLWVDSSIPDKMLNQLLKDIEQEGYRVAIKGHGVAWLYDINSAVLNGHVIGIPAVTLKHWQRTCDVYKQLAYKTAPLDKRFSHLDYRNERISLRQLREVLTLAERGIDWGWD